MKQENIVTFYGQIRVAAVRPNETQPSGLSHFQITTRYINNINKTVRAKLRSNVELSFPKVAIRQPYSHDNCFIVRKELVVNQPCIEQMRQYFTNLPDSVGELETFREAFLQVHENVYVFGQTRELRCTVEHVFSEKDLVAHGGIFYHDELDTLFKLGEEPFTVAHPNSAAGREQTLLEQATKMRDEHGFIFWIEIIDNLGKYDDRFVSLCNQIYKITPKADKNRPDGLYIVSSKPSNGRISSLDLQQRNYSLEDNAYLEKELGVYATYELAQSHGDLAGAKKREMQEREHQMALEKQEWAREKLNMEREAAELQRRNRELEAEREATKQTMASIREQQNHLMEMQRLQSKDKYEERSAERKDASEFIKFLPTILAGVGTILMAWSAWRKG